jgi:hypothetical protein
MKGLWRVLFMLILLLLLLHGADPSAGSLRVVINPLSQVGGSEGEAPLILRVPEDYAKIQEAIDAAPEGSIILIGAGEYQEDLVIAKSLTLWGSGPTQTIIKGTGTPSIILGPPGAEIGIAPTIHIQGEGLGGELIQVTLKGLRIHASLYPEEGDLHISYKAVLIEGGAQATLQGNHISGMVGIDVYAFSERTQLTLLQNTIISSGIGIGGAWTLAHAQIFMDGNVIRAQGEGIHGLNLIGADQVLMLKERIEGWQTGISIGASWVSIQESAIEGNRDGIVVMPNSLLRLSRSKVMNNDRYGVAIWDERCFPELKEVGPPGELPLAIQGGGNLISGNGKADLCPEDYPWPEGFRKP